MSDIFTSRQMEGVEPVEQAKRAIQHTLQTLSENHDAAYHLGLGSQTYSLLTEAAATLWGKPLGEVRRMFLCQDKREPAAATMHQISAAWTDYVIRHHESKDEMDQRLAKDRVIAEIMKVMDGRAA